MDARNEGLGLPGQRIAPAASGSGHASTRPPEFHGSGGAAPVLNYSIRTGEEFAFEFIRERALPRKSSAPNAPGDQNAPASTFMDLRGILGISHTGSEAGSDASMFATGDRSQTKEIEKRSFSEVDNKGHYASASSLPQASTGDGSSRGISHGYASSDTSDYSSTKMKFLCSFGGRILPRPSDRKLRYVGGDTRILRLSRDVSWRELVQKTLAIYHQPHTIKYQLPGEDLDALVTVSSDEDVQIMMEECSVLGGDGSQKLRLFLLPSGDFDDMHYGLGSLDSDSEVHYVVAVNGIDAGAGKSLDGHGLGSVSSDLDQLLNLNFENDRNNTSIVASKPAGVSVNPMAGNPEPPPMLSSNMQQNLPSNYDSTMYSHQDNAVPYFEGRPYPCAVIPQHVNIHNSDGRMSMPISVPSDYDYNYHYLSHGGISVPPPPPPQLNFFHQGMNEGLHSFTRVQGPGMITQEMNMTVDGASLQKNESAYIHSFEVAPKQPNDGPVQKFSQVESYGASAPEHVPSVLPFKHGAKNVEPAQKLSSHDANPGQVCDSNEDDRQSAGAFTSGYSDYEGDMHDLSYNDQSARPSRVYHSEMIPRELGESRNRLSKSDDSIGSQYLILHSRSGVTQDSIAEAVDPSLEGKSIDQPTLAGKPLNSYSKPTMEPPMRLEKRDLKDAISQKKQTEGASVPEESKAVTSYHQPLGGNDNDALINRNSQVHEEAVINPVACVMNDPADGKSDEQNQNIGRRIQNPEFDQAMKTSVYDNNTLNENKILKGSDSSTSLENLVNAGEKSTGKINMKQPPVDGAGAVEMVQTSAVADIANKQQENLASVLPKIHWEEKTAKDAYGFQGSSAETAEEPTAVPGQKDILIDINDRFPPGLLSNIFTQARFSDDPSSTNPLRKDDTGLSLNMQNHEPQKWSFFRNLAPDEFSRKDISLMDQDHIGYSSLLNNGEELAARTYEFSPLQNEGVDVSHIGLPIDLEDEMQQELSGKTVGGTNTLHPPVGISSQVVHTHLKDKVGESLQVDNPYSNIGENLRNPVSEYEELKFDVGLAGGPVIDVSAADVDLSDLQIIKNEDLEELRELGSGTFGTVYHGKWRGSDVAIKRIKKSCFTGRSSEQERLTIEFWREADILSKLHHPNVVAFYGVVQDGPGGTMATVTEFMVNGSLRNVLQRKDRYLDRRKCLIIAMDAAFGMEYLHSKNIVHFDLKCDNLLVNLKDQSRPICKVGDFGLSKIKRNTLVSGGVRGTLPWMAPELLNGGSNKVSEKVDVFSFGIVMWEILTGEEPYANMHYGAIIGGIVNNTLRPPVPASCDPEWRKLMEQCWSPDPAQRPSFTQIASRLRTMSAAVQSKLSK
ncbi:Non-specific serine/threonine protein kinase protein [Dioscorea alata]|uniref:Non-specific serine/threonine protein kinase protein n=1 Tax=Dioscorea alata TaxID=55571 RepID=A0ACB7W8J0_DIOAL|nr:Non-specific serine/threonine protein kinase protein [Dioscorea alata]